MPDQIIARPGFRDVNVRYVDMADTSFAEKVVVVNPDGTPIAGGGGGNVTKATAAAPVYVEGATVPLSVDLAGNLRILSGGGGGGMTDAEFTAHLPLSTNPTDRAARLVGVVYGSQGQQVKQTATNFNLATELHVGATAIDPRSIRALTAADVVTAQQGGAPWSVTFPSAQSVDVTDRVGRLVGVVTAANLDVALSTRLKPADTLAAVTTVSTVTNLSQMGGVAISLNTGVRDAGTQRVTIATNDVVPVTGTFFQATQPVSIAAAVDVSDRAARLVGVVYGSQAQQLKQTATNFNAQVEIAVGATLVDPRSIRALTSADVVTAAQGTAAATAAAWPVKVTDGTNIGAVKAASVLAVATDPAMVVQDSPMNARAAVLIVTATGAAAAAVTATLPAPAAGLFHYITRINIIKYASVATVGAAAPTVITSTNLPGAAAWTLPTALAVGTQYETDVEPASPIKSSVAATATTIVAAGLASIIYRITVYYYTAP